MSTDGYYMYRRMAQLYCYSCVVDMQLKDYEGPFQVPRHMICGKCRLTIRASVDAQEERISSSLPDLLRRRG